VIACAIPGVNGTLEIIGTGKEKDHYVMRHSIDELLCQASQSIVI